MEIESLMIFYIIDKLNDLNMHYERVLHYALPTNRSKTTFNLYHLQFYRMTLWLSRIPKMQSVNERCYYSF